MAQLEKDRGDRTLAQVLSQSELMDTEALEPLMAMQVEEAIFHLFSWGNGAFHFDPDQTLAETMPRVSMNAEALLLEGARRVDEWGQIQKKIPSTDLIFGMVDDPPDEAEAELTKDQTKVLALLDGERTVDDLIKASGLLDFDTSKALFGLLVAGFIERVGTRVVETEQEPSEPEARQFLKLARAFFKAGMFEDAERELERSVDAWPAFGTARRILGALLLKHRRFDEALQHFARVEGPGGPHVCVLPQSGRGPGDDGPIGRSPCGAGRSRRGILRRSGAGPGTGNLPTPRVGPWPSAGEFRPLSDADRGQDAQPGVFRLHDPRPRYGR